MQGETPQPRGAVTGDTADPLKLYTEAETAELLGLKPATLIDWRCRRKPGPRWVKVGRTVYYRPRDLAAWLDAQTRGSNGPAPAEDAAGGGR